MVVMPHDVSADGGHPLGRPALPAGPHHRRLVLDGFSQPEVDVGSGIANGFEQIIGQREAVAGGIFGIGVGIREEMVEVNAVKNAVGAIMNPHRRDLPVAEPRALIVVPVAVDGSAVDAMNAAQRSQIMMRVYKVIIRVTAFRPIPRAGCLVPPPRRSRRGATKRRPALKGRPLRGWRVRRLR